MKKIGSVKLDGFGRVPLPPEVRAALRLPARGTLNLYVEEGRILLEPVPSCSFCGAAGPLVKCGDYNLCKKCLEKL